MRQPRPRVVAKPYTFPAAVGGWNAIDALDAMPPQDAETMVNMFPETTSVRLRRGYTGYTTMPDTEPVTALAAYNGATDKLLAFMLDTWYDVTGGVATALVGGFGSLDISWDSTNFATAGGQYLIAVAEDGNALPQIYDGATMVDAANTVGGVPSVLRLNRVCIFNQRVYYAEADTLSMWYLPVGQYQGALTEFDFGPLCAKGGKIAKIATWTRDNAAAGANEMFVMVTTEGEVLIYTGENPGGVWQISARFEVGKPVSGPNCIVRLGPDCILICEDGFQPMAHYLQLGQSQASSVAISRKIGNAVTAAIRAYGTEQGWTGTLYPRANMLVFNIPQSGGVFEQYTANTLTGAWCRWTGQNGISWAVFNNDLYFGGIGVVSKADTGTSDNGQDIAVDYRGSYQYLSGPGVIKVSQMARPVFRADGPLTLSFGVDVDFVNTNLTAPASSLASGGLWGSAIWGSAVWGSGQALQQQWISVGAIGYAMAPHFKFSTNALTVDLLSIGFLYETGAYI